VVAPAFLPSTLLGRLDEATRAELLKLGVQRSVDEGEALLREGAVETHVVLLLDALAKVSVQMADGRQALMAIRIAGDLVGEISALNGTPRIATVTTCIPSTISIIHRNEFRPFLRSHGDAALEVAGIVADRLRRATRHRVDFMSYSVKTRLARILVELAEAYGARVPSGVVIGVQLTHPELAGLCGAAEVSLQKALRELRDAGLVATGYRQVIVLDLVALRGIADL
jgi:CRP/FNR family cyclic AMP-dependent transcriptional regulator